MPFRRNIANTIFRALFRPRPTLQGPPRPATTTTTVLRSSMPSIPFLSALFSSKPTPTMTHPDTRPDSEWRAVLSPEQFRILREKGTEPPGSGKFDKHYPAEGVYTCAGCATPLYK